MNSAFRLWSDVRIFLAVVREGSTLAASKTLGIAQPSVARRIDALEHELGLQLFYRDTRGFRLTDDGAALTPQAEDMEKAALALEKTARDLRSERGGVIRLTAAQSTFTDNLAGILSEFTDSHPDVSFKFIAAERTLDLSAGDADVAIRHARIVDDQRLICRKLGIATGSLYASRRYADRFGLPGSPDELKGHRIIFGKAPSMKAFYAWLRDIVDPDQVVMQCQTTEELMTALASGVGLAPLGSGMGDPNPNLIRCFPPPRGTEVTTWLLASPDAYRRAEVRSFMSFFAPRYSAFLRAQREEFDALVRQKEAREA